MNKTVQLSLIIPMVVALVVTPIYPTFASVTYRFQMLAMDPQAIVCNGLNIVGIGCTSPTSSAPAPYQSQPIRLNFDVFGGSSGNSNSSTSDTANTPDNKTTVTNAKLPKDLTGQKINIVSVPESPEIYELVNGKKHAFPSLAVYYDYGYILAMIQPITQQQLDRYSRASLVKVKGDSKIYYLTEGGMVRQIVNPKKIFEFYGDRKEDIITISRKEFNYYPTNEYVYQISPLNRDVFQVSAAGKRYITPMAVYRLGLRVDQVAPVVQAELNSYKTLPPLVD